MKTKFVNLKTEYKKGFDSGTNHPEIYKSEIQKGKMMSGMMADDRPAIKAYWQGVNDAIQGSAYNPPSGRVEVITFR